MAEYNDGSGGTIPHSSRTLNIGNVIYAAEQFTVTEPVNMLERMNAVTNNPDGQVAFPGFTTGTALLQLDNAENAPAQFANFISTIRGVNANFFVTDVGHPESMGDAKKVNITFRKRIN